MENSLHINIWVAIIGLIGAIFGSSVITALINNWFSSKKRDADTKATSITAEVKLGEGWQLFVKTQQDEITGLRKDMADIVLEHRSLLKKYTDLQTNYETLDKNYKLLSEKHDQLLSDNIYLKTRVIELQKELENNNK